MSGIFDTLLLLALPASGKSEVRTYLTAKDPAQFHMGPTVQLDDYPYVHLQLRLDEEMLRLGLPKLFHEDDPGSSNGPYLSVHEWGGLCQLLNDDYHALRRGAAPVPADPARHLLQRLDDAVVRAGGRAKLSRLPRAVQDTLADRMADDVRKHYDDLAAGCPPSLAGRTIVIEFARGGPEGSDYPLPDGYGYAGSLAQLSPEVLERAAILYIWVTPEESRRKNRARAKPGAQGSILFHGAPESVMRREYGCDDMDYLLTISDVPDTVRIESGGRVFHIPTARFDNRVDSTSFLRKPEAEWLPAEIGAIHDGLKEACDRLWTSYQKQRAGR
jgi:hypothetical protein